MLARLTIAGDPDARRDLDECRDQALAEQQDLPSVPVRGRGDTWGTIRRRLAALAEAYNRIPGCTPDAVALATAAAGINRGFAGFSAPATLTVAETVAIVDPRNTDLITRCLDAALAAAHNIQDPVFCARTTARVEAIRRHWWPAPALIAATVDGLARDPHAVRFATLHTVGEQYAARVPAPTDTVRPASAASTISPHSPTCSSDRCWNSSGSTRSTTRRSNSRQAPRSRYQTLVSRRSWQPDSPRPSSRRARRTRPRPNASVT